MEEVDERLAQRGYEGERTAHQHHWRPQLAAVGKGRHRLHCHGTEDGGSDIALRRILGDEVLYVGLAEYATARGDGIGLRGLTCQCIQRRHIHIEQHRHLVDEGSRATGTVAIHAQVFRPALLEEHNFGILAADINHRGHLGVAVLHILGCCHHFLHEVQPLALGHTHGHRAGEADAILHLLTQFLAQLPEAVLHAPQHIGIMTLIVGKQRLRAIINGYRFQRRGPYIQSHSNILHNHQSYSMGTTHSAPNYTAKLTCIH